MFSYYIQKDSNFSIFLLCKTFPMLTNLVIRNFEITKSLFEKKLRQEAVFLLIISADFQLIYSKHSAVTNQTGSIKSSLSARPGYISKRFTTRRLLFNSLYIFCCLHFVTILTSYTLLVQVPQSAVLVVNLQRYSDCII